MESLNSLTVIQLRALISVAETGSLVVTSRHLHLSSSQISRYVSQAEAALGVVIFERRGPKLILNQIGIQLLPRLTLTMNEVVGCVHEGRMLREGKAGVLRVGYTQLTSLTGLPKLLRLIQNELPGVSIRLESTDDLTLESRLQSRKIDLALITAPLHSGGFETHTIHSDPLCLAVPEEWETDEEISLFDERLTHILVAPRAGWPGTWQRLAAYCESQSLDLNFDESVNDAIGRIALVAANGNAAMVSKIRQRTVWDGVKIIPISGIPNLSFETVVAKAAQSNPTAERAFAKTVKMS